ncbi:FtsX-like permease family protein [Thalassospiraceae bacterium LMO-JJ14]|nr:FtsX-like permease family protein [Thalassospiraceae bacterium LMO-JJ14]
MNALSAIDKKLLRDLWRLRAQVIAIAMVIASGVALLITALTSGEALRETTDAYYERYRFADVFASVKRAPETLVVDIANIPGVKQAESRIVDIATVDIAGFAEPATARIVSLPDDGVPLLNRIALSAGRPPHPGRVDEAVLGERFAAAHGLNLGAKISILLNGRQRKVTVVGHSLAPEFIYVIAPGAIMPDDKRFGVIWMNRDALAGAFDMEGAFNDISLSLNRSVEPDRVVARLDTLLAKYGSAGAFPRDRQLSNRFVQNEIDQADTMAVILPTIFLAIAAFLTNMIMTRLIATEREEIGLFKAFGYSDRAVAWHYIKMVLVIACLGIAIGIVIGSWFGQIMLAMYGENYQFPFLIYRPSPQSYAISFLVSIGTAVVGSLRAVRAAASLPPAEAMRPPAPPIYRKSWLARTRIADALDEPTRMVLRRLGRWPIGAALSMFGIALSLSVLLLALQWDDAINEMIEDYFFRASHQDATISLLEPGPLRVLHDVAALPGVMAVEGQRVVSAKIHAGHISRRHGVIGITEAARLAPIHDVTRGALALPENGVVLSTSMAGVLGVGKGDWIRLELLEGRRPIRELRVAETFEAYIDTPIYMHLDALSRLLLESRQVNWIHVRVDAAERAAFLSALKETPRLSAVSFRESGITIFRDTIEKNIMVFIGFYTLFSCSLAFGVIYNTLRIALAERSRELATLRVLGFNRAEISYILLGETGILTFAALPVGVGCGYLLSEYIAEKFSTELFRVPLVVHDATAGLAAVGVLGTVVICALVIRRRLDKLDMIEVLKTRE